MPLLPHSRCLHGMDHTPLAALADADIVPALQSAVLQGCQSYKESARLAEGPGVCWAQVKEEINAPELAPPEDEPMPHATQPAALPNGDAHAASDAPEASVDAQAQVDAPGGIIVAVKTEAEEEQKPASLLLETGSAVKVLSSALRAEMPHSMMCCFTRGYALVHMPAAAMSCHVAVMSSLRSQNL